jgi:hypothetical protein
MALSGEDIEHFRPLLPVGYETTAAAYRNAAANLTAADLTGHYTSGLRFFHEEFVPHLKTTLCRLSGGAWDLDGYSAFAAGSDVDFMGHILETASTQRNVAVYPGDWFGFKVGVSQPERVRFTPESRDALVS